MYIHACTYSIEGGEGGGVEKKKEKNKKRKENKKKKKKEIGDYAQPHHVHVAWFSQLVRYPTSGSGPSLAAKK